MRYPTGLYTYSLKTGAAAQLLEETTYRIRTCGYIGGQVVFAGSDLKRYGNQENPWFYVLRDGKPQVFAQNEESAMNSVGSDCRYGGGLTYKVRQDGIYFLSTMGGDAVVKRAAWTAGSRPSPGGTARWTALTWAPGALPASP